MSDSINLVMWGTHLGVHGLAESGVGAVTLQGFIPIGTVPLGTLSH